MLGKCTEDVKTRVSFSTKEAIQKLAHDTQMSESEYVRTILQIHVHGLDTVQSLQQDRINRVANAGESDGQKCHKTGLKILFPP